MSNADQLEHRVNVLEKRVIELEQELREAKPATTHHVSTDDVELVTSSDRTYVTLRQAVLDTISEFERAYGNSAPTDYITDQVADEEDRETDDVKEVLDTLTQEGSIYEPIADHVRVV